MITVIALITTVLVLSFVLYKMYWLRKPKSREISVEEVKKAC